MNRTSSDTRIDEIHPAQQEAHRDERRQGGEERRRFPRASSLPITTRRGSAPSA
jgi:hypothetical protein